MREALRKGWCPSAAQPMASGDGLIVRVNIADGIVVPAHARALAHLAGSFGNGLIDLTGRANLQLRGVSDTSLPLLQAELLELGLMDADGAPSAARNILISPLADLDPQAIMDVRPSAAVLRALLRHEAIAHALPDKFGMVVDGGGVLSVAAEKTDICFLARQTADGADFSIRLAGVPAGTSAVDEVSETALRIVRAFLDLREDAAERMQGLAQRIGVKAIAERAGLRGTVDAVLRPETPKPVGSRQLGRFHILGLGIPFGRLNGEILDHLAQAAEACSGELRLTPWRTVLIVGARKPDAAALADLGLIFSQDDPLRIVAACPGAPGCASGTTATQNDGRRLAALAGRVGAPGIAVHVSGCAKGCAHAGVAPFTFVGRDGRYDLVRDGAAGDMPLMTGLEAHCLSDVLRKFLKIDA